jgi:hypothetical protein
MFLLVFNQLLPIQQKRRTKYLPFQQSRQSPKPIRMSSLVTHDSQPSLFQSQNIWAAAACLNFKTSFLATGLQAL